MAMPESSEKASSIMQDIVHTNGQATTSCATLVKALRRKTTVKAVKCQHQGDWTQRCQKKPKGHKMIPEWT